MTIDPKRKKRLIVLGSILGLMVFLGIAALMVPAPKAAKKQTGSGAKKTSTPASSSSVQTSESGEDNNDESSNKVEIGKNLRFNNQPQTQKKEKKADRPADSKQPDNIQILKKEDDVSTVRISSKKNSWNPIVGKNPKNGTLAERLLPGDGTRIRWVPRKTDDISSVRLTDAELSPDHSIVAFVETTGPYAGPYGSRIVLMDTNSWTTVKICEIKDRHITKIQWIPGKEGWIGAICHLYSGEDESEKQNPGVALIDLLEGKEKHFYKLPDGVGETGFISDGKTRLLLSHPQKPILCVIDAADPEKPVAETGAPGINCVLALSADRKCFAAMPQRNAKKIDLFKTSDLLPLSTVKWGNRSLYPAEILFIRDDRSTFLICSHRDSSDPAYRVSEGQLFELPGTAPGKNNVSSGKGAVSSNGKDVYNLLYGNNDLCIINAVNGQLIRAIEINDISPRPTRSPALIAHFFLLPELQAIAALDEAGYFYLIKTVKLKQGKIRNERAIIFEPQQ